MRKGLNSHLDHFSNLVAKLSAISSQEMILLHGFRFPKEQSGILTLYFCTCVKIFINLKGQF